MADVLLSVGVSPDLDFTQFEKDLNEIFSRYEKTKKPTINIEFQISKDAQSSLNNLDNVLKGIQSKAESTAASLKKVADAVQKAEQPTAGDKKQTDKNNSKYREGIKVIKEYFDALKQLQKSETDITKVNGKFTSESGKWENLAKVLNETADAYARIGDTVKELPESMGKNLTAQMQSAQKNYNLWLEQVTNQSNAVTQKTNKANQEKIDILDRRASELQSKLRGYLTNYSGAKTSQNSESRDAYNNMYTRIQELEKFREALHNAQDAQEDLTTAVGNFEEQLKREAAATQEDASVIRTNDDNHKSFGKTLENMAKKFSTWLTASQLIMLAVRSVRQMVNEAVSVDTAMTQMQIVTKASSEEMKQFGNTAAKVAKQTASSMTDIINSATTYARLGYSMDTSTMLAQYTSMISKVGDIEVSDVQSAVTAIVKAFNIDANDTAAIEAVFDKLVTTGNNLPVSVKELAEGLNNAASALSAAGNSYEQSLGLLAASNATIQDISKSSTGLRTIVARIRNTKTELDDLGESMTDAEYNNIVQALTQYKVSLTDSQGNLRNTYDIIKDIAAVAKELKETSPNDYAALAETLAGTRMQNVFFSLVENFNEAEKAMGLMGDSAGALNDAFDTYSQSIAAHIEKFKAQFQELSVALVDSGLANAIIDIGTGLLQMVTAITKAGMAVPTLVAVAAALKSIKSIS